MRSGDWFRLGPSVAFELGPNSGEGERKPVVAQCVPHDIFLAGLRVGLQRIQRSCRPGPGNGFPASARPRQCGEAVLRMF